VVIKNRLATIALCAFRVKNYKNELISFKISACPSIYIYANNSEITEGIFMKFELRKFNKFVDALIMRMRLV
jgi:hypothetical protein